MPRVPLLLGVLAPAALLGQEGAGAELWRLAAPTLAPPPAPATGGGARLLEPGPHARAARRHGDAHRGVRDPLLLALRRERRRPGPLGRNRLLRVARCAVAGRRRGLGARSLRDYVDARLHPGPPVRRGFRAGRPLCHRSAPGARGELQRGPLALRGWAGARDRSLPSHAGREPRRRRRRRIVSHGRGGLVPVTDLLSLTPDAARAAIAPWLTARSEPAYRAKQILARLWQRPVASWEEATELPAALRR